MGARAMTEEKFYTIKEIADLLKVHPRTVRKMIHAKEIDAIRVRDEYRITESALEEYIRRQSRK
jgi:excisionase family DNA binding protein